MRDFAVRMNDALEESVAQAMQNCGLTTDQELFVEMLALFIHGLEEAGKGRSLYYKDDFGREQEITSRPLIYALLRAREKRGPESN